MTANATGEAQVGPLRLQFDRSFKLAFHGSAISSSGSLLLHRELDDALSLTDMVAELIADPLTGKNGRHRLTCFLRQSVFSRLAGYEDVSDAGRLRRDPVMRQIVGGRAVKHGAASAVWNGHFQSKCLHPLFVFKQYGDLERCSLRPGKVHNADGWEDVLKPVLALYSTKARSSIERRRFRVDAAFAVPALFDLLEAESWDYAVHIRGNPKLYDQIGWLIRRRPSRPPDHVLREYTSFHCRAKIWSKARRVVVKVEFHPGELFPRVCFTVTNRSLPNERVLAFYNQRGTAEQHMKEGKHALK